MENNCIFCLIIQKKIPSYSLFEDSKILAFLDINPGTLGHTLVIPKIHIKNFFEIKEDQLMLHFFKKVQFIAQILKDTLNADGLNLIQNNEPAAGQAVFHLHFHLLPRWNNDNKLTLRTIEKEKSKDYFDHLQLKIKNAIL